MRSLMFVATAVLVWSLMSGSVMAAGETVTVTLQNGRTMQGELLSQTPDEVVLSISGIKTPLPRATIRSMEVEKSIEQQYAEKLSKVDRADAQARLGIAAFLYNNKAYRLAEQELLQVLKIEPGHVGAKRLLDATRAWIAQQERENDDEPKTTTTLPPSTDDSPTGKLSEEDINWIRLYEYSFADRLKPRVIVPREVIQFMYERYADNAQVPKGVVARRGFLKKQGFEQLNLLFQIGDRNLWGHVIVRGDPEPMRTFRTRIHNSYVLNYCGAANCHGGAGHGDLLLFRDRANFYILSQYQTPSGYMIDRDAPTRSLLIQYGLPHNRARVRHPDLGGWKPNPALVRGENTPLYRTLVEWMGRELYKPAPRYEEVIDYTIPGKNDEPGPRDRLQNDPPQEAQDNP